VRLGSVTPSFLLFATASPPRFPSRPSSVLRVFNFSMFLASLEKGPSADFPPFFFPTCFPAALFAIFPGPISSLRPPFPICRASLLPFSTGLGQGGFFSFCCLLFFSRREKFLDFFLIFGRLSFFFDRVTLVDSFQIFFFFSLRFPSKRKRYMIPLGLPFFTFPNGSNPPSLLLVSGREQALPFFWSSRDS